ncbi:hypothetical protein B4U37_14440 [Sutcliffiella horikoshii]|uniref:Uncharacterized protein n=1 Tax=Sutcliffiella horikoshii TaxID=79883 RepID=A0ABM6KL43_9BACI|nr:hypothetical protein [Sutcliffiella horikoshii]ART77173.1 hypothetical protein B4U37_14440 [Sutcliffiella horikoshii]
MKNSRLHDDLQSFPKNHRLKEQNLKSISNRINKELAMSQTKVRKGIPKNRKVVATTLLTLTMAAILIWSIGGQQNDIQNLAGIHSDKVIIIENKQNVSIQEEISPADIYSVSQSQNSWAVDPREPRNLLFEGTSIVHLKVLDIKEA